MTADEHITEAERFAESAAAGKDHRYGQQRATLALAHATIALALNDTGNREGI